MNYQKMSSIIQKTSKCTPLENSAEAERLLLQEDKLFFQAKNQLICEHLGIDLQTLHTRMDSIEKDKAFERIRRSGNKMAEIVSKLEEKSAKAKASVAKAREQFIRQVLASFDKRIENTLPNLLKKAFKERIDTMWADIYWDEPTGIAIEFDRLILTYHSVSHGMEESYHHECVVCLSKTVHRCELTALATCKPLSLDYMAVLSLG